MQKYTKEQLVRASTQKEVYQVALEDGKKYTKKQADREVKRFLERKV